VVDQFLAGEGTAKVLLHHPTVLSDQLAGMAGETQPGVAAADGPTATPVRSGFPGARTGATAVAAILRSLGLGRVAVERLPALGADEGDPRGMLARHGGYLHRDTPGAVTAAARIPYSDRGSIAGSG
jgi:hypothetical protein